MPHSSGGGSHRSGSHSSRSSSHRSSSRSSSHRSSYRSDRYRSERYSSRSFSFGSDRVTYARVSKTPFPGASRYRYYHHGSYRYCYSAQDPGKLFRPRRLLLGLFYVPFLAAAFGMILAAVLPLVVKTKTFDVVIKDEAGILDSRYELEGALEAFRDKTGVTPAVITVRNETWQKRFDGLESYAYNRYVSEFSDELHWLLVYSEPVMPDPEFNDWYWEGIQGDLTDSVITPAVADGMTDMVQTGLESGDSLTVVLENAFQEMTDSITVKKPTLLSEFSALIPALLILAFVCFHAYFMLGLNELKYKNAELDPDAPENYPDPGVPFRETPSQAMPALSSGGPYGTQQPYGAQQPYGTQQPYGRPAAEPERESEMPSLTGLQEQPQPAAMPSVSPPVPPAPAETAKFGDLETDVCRWCGTRYVRGISYCPGCGVSLAEFRRDDLNN